MKRRSLLGAAALSVLPTSMLRAAPDKPDAARFMAAPQMLGAVLSPNGQRVALRTLAKHGRVVLTVLDLATMAPTVVYGTDEADVRQVVWVNSDRLAFDLTDRDMPEGKIDAAPGLFAVNHDGTALRQLVERQYTFVRAAADVKLAPWNTFLLDDTTQCRGDEVLAVRPEAHDGKDVGYVKLLRMNTKTGRSEDIDGPMHAVDWAADPQGNLRVAVTRQAEKGALLWRDPKTDQWRTLSEFNVYTGESDFQVRHVGADGWLYVTAQRGSDKLAMWRMNPATGEWSAKPLAQSPQFDVDAHVVAREDKVLGLRFTIDAEVTQWLDPDMAALQAQIDKALPRTVNRLSLPWTGDAPWVLIEAFADIQPTLFFLFNRQTRKFTRLGAERPDIVAKDMAAMDMVRIKARDGLEIPAWLSLPKGAEKQKNLPMVVLVHGGPFVSAPSWRWDAEVQFLTARGYAVLQPQFRGTTGFGAAHFRSGWRQWGKAMQTDLADATRWAIAQGIADPKRIAIAGASYGGYATLMGLLRDPDLFRCGVAWVGVTDLDMLYSVNWSDMSDSVKKHGFPAMLGDPLKDAADLKENSPLTHAAEIKQPMLLAYGSADRRVPLVHGEAFRKAVRAGGAQVEWVVYDDEGHGWRAPKNQIDFWNRTARFLDQYLAPT
ncbi:MAG: S9 family peptidase [Burkholderiaceae bacterium]|nr:S9 family peptidase [Burkholderiaceae bacterium]